MSTPGATPTESSQVARVQDRISFLYTERCVVNRDQNALTISDDKGTIHLPVAQLSALLLGPGSSLSHKAIGLLAESGVCTVWVGEHGVRYYAHGRPLARSTRLLQAQVAAVTNHRSRLAVARRMYAMRFPDDVTEGMTMQQLRGFEGSRVRRAYRSVAKEYGISWSRRNFDPDDFFASDEPNMALTAATACLYGIVQSVVVALGCSPGIGFIHVGKDQSFVFDIADLYKVELAVPVAFQAVSDGPHDDLPSVVRRRMRDLIHEKKLLTRCVKDIHYVLGLDERVEVEEWDILQLWDERGPNVASGVSWDTTDVPW